MKNNKFKKLIIFASLLLVLGGLIAGYVIQKNINENNPNNDLQEEDTSFTVFDKGSSIVTAISFKYEDESLSFTYVNDDWVYDGDRKYPLDQDRIASMAQAIGTVSATVKVDNISEDMSDYGFDAPVLTVNATFSDKTEKIFTFGDVNSFNECQYFKISGDDSIYMVSSDVAVPFATDLDTLYEPESYPLLKESVTDEDVTSVTLCISGKTKEITDDNGIKNLFELIYTLDLSTWEDYYADSEEMASVYNISPEGDRVIVNYTDEVTGSDGSVTKVPKTYVVYIGADYEAVTEENSDKNTDTDSEEKEKEKFYFYSFNSSSVVYGADGETVDEIFSYLAYEPKTADTAAE